MTKELAGIAGIDLDRRTPPPTTSLELPICSTAAFIDELAQRTVDMQKYRDSYWQAVAWAELARAAGEAAERAYFEVYRGALESQHQTADTQARAVAARLGLEFDAVSRGAG